MYRCELCGNLKEGKQIRKVVQVRMKQYRQRYNERGEVVDKGGEGRETVKEVKLCDSCNT